MIVRSEIGYNVLRLYIVMKATNQMSLFVPYGNIICVSFVRSCSVRKGEYYALKVNLKCGLLPIGVVFTVTDNRVSPPKSLCKYFQY